MAPMPLASRALTVLSICSSEASLVNSLFGSLTSVAIVSVIGSTPLCRLCVSVSLWAWQAVHPAARASNSFDHSQSLLRGRDKSVTRRSTKHRRAHIGGRHYYARGLSLEA